jgi:hypothetical protein
MNFAISKTPNCVQDPTFTLASTPSALFASRTINADGESGFVRLNSFTLLHGGSYAMTLDAAVDAQTTQITFNVKIVDPCIRAVFETNPAPINNMVITMPTIIPTT